MGSQIQLILGEYQMNSLRSISCISLPSLDDDPDRYNHCNDGDENYAHTHSQRDGQGIWMGQSLLIRTYWLDKWWAVLCSGKKGIVSILLMHERNMTTTTAESTSPIIVRVPGQFCFKCIPETWTLCSGHFCKDPGPVHALKTCGHLSNWFQWSPKV